MSLLNHPPRLSKVRKEIYSTIFEITGTHPDKEQRQKIQAAVRTYVTEANELQEFLRKPHKHMLVCKKCQAEELVVGRNAYKGKRRGFVCP